MPWLPKIQVLRRRPDSFTTGEHIGLFQRHDIVVGQHSVDGDRRMIVRRAMANPWTANSSKTSNGCFAPEAVITVCRGLKRHSADKWPLVCLFRRLHILIRGTNKFPWDE